MKRQTGNNLIRLLTYDRIDKNAWDQCIEKSPNRLIYAKSNYLDIMSPRWQALILNEYEAVMPLPVRKKWGINYIFQPAFFQQGGIYSQLLVNKELTERFITAVMKHFPFAEICMNHSNEIPDIPGLSVRRRNNFIIRLNKKTDELIGNFSGSFIKNAAKANKAGLIYEATHDLKGAILFYRSLYASRMPSIKRTDYEHFEKLASFLQSKNCVIIRKVSEPSGQLLAIILLLRDGNRLYNLMSGNTPRGRVVEANYFLFDKLIREFAETDFMLDLEGSDLPGIADFYLRMGPESEPYAYIRYNRLPRILKLFKK